jgi:hypothetical protein
LNDILIRADIYKEIIRRQNLFHTISRQKILDLLFLHGSKQQMNDSYLALLKQTIADGHSKDMLDAFDRACLANYNKLQILSCLFSAIANTLAEMAGGDRAGLRSGPYLNREWQYALLMFEEGKYLLGIQHLIKQRQLWIDRSDLLIRAARHYDGKTSLFYTYDTVKHVLKEILKYYSVRNFGISPFHMNHNHLPFFLPVLIHSDENIVFIVNITYYV